MVHSYFVSVIIPTKNRIDIVKRAIISASSQEDVEMEVIVVDDGSTDGTFDFISNNFPSIKLIRNEKSLGGAASRNIGVDAAKGDYVAFLDSDDEWLPDHLKNKIDFINKNNIDGVYSPFYLKRDAEMELIKFYTKFPDNFGIADKNAAFKYHDTRTSTFVFRKAPFLSVQFDSRLLKHQDWDLAINFDKKYKFLCHNSPSAIIDIGPSHNRMSNTLKHEATQYFYNKNKSNFTPKGAFLFNLNMIMLSQMHQDHFALSTYYSYLKELLPKVDYTYKILYYMLKLKLLNLSKMRMLKHKFKQLIKSK